MQMRLRFLQLLRRCAGVSGWMGCMACVWASGFQPLNDFKADPVQTARLGRALALMRSASPDHHPTVRVMFYGQSITIYPWWREVAEGLRSAYPHVHFEFSNLAISGFMADRLALTAEQDVIPAQPDLVILHAYGEEPAFDDLLARIRTGSTADVLVQSDHPLTYWELVEETDPSRLVNGATNTWEYRNYVSLPRVTSRHGFCLADVRGYWKQYCRLRDRPARSLLADATHPNEEGNHVMAAAVLSYLLPSVPAPETDPWATTRVLELPLPRSPVRPPRRLVIEFEGTRVDAVTDQAGTAPVEVWIDGRAPSQIPGLRGFRRATLTPGRPWPAITPTASTAPLLAETWTLSITSISEDNARIDFRLDGSETGFDGTGSSTGNFTSNSRRVFIPGRTWLLGYALNSQGMSLPAGYRIQWNCEWVGMDRFNPITPSASGREATFTLASGLTDGRHRVELDGTSMEAVRALRFFSPSARVSATLVERDDLIVPLDLVWRRRESGWVFRLAGTVDTETVLETSTNRVDWSVIGPAMPGMPDWLPAPYESMRFFRLISRPGTVNVSP